MRGGGNLKDDTFRPFRTRHLKSTIQRLSDLRNYCMTGIGHFGDRFPAESAADHTAITPTAAAAHLNKLFLLQTATG